MSEPFTETENQEIDEKFQKGLDDFIRDQMEEYYYKILYSCIQGGMTVANAKKEALCALRAFERDAIELDAILDQIMAQPLSETIN